MVINWPLAANVLLKSPARWRAVGTVAVRVDRLRSRRPAMSKRKKVLSLRIGPETSSPYWLRLKLPSGTLFLFEKKLLASNSELRRNSIALPWKPFVPERYTTLSMDPWLRPYSAGGLAPMTLNSAIDSTDGKAETPPAPLAVGCDAATPSTRVSSTRTRAPLTEYCMSS